MKLNLIGPFVINAPFGTEIAFAKGLRRLGHEVVEVDPNVDRDMRGMRNDFDVTVVFKSCVGSERYLKSLRHPIVVYQPDDARFRHITEMIVMMREYADLFLSFDGNGARVAKLLRYRAAEPLLLTADDELYCPSPTSIERDIDVSFIGSLGDPVAHASRRRMIQVVQDEAERCGWKTHWEVSQDIDHVRDVYRRSKVVLNHATDVGQAFGYGYGYQCRHFEVGMTKTALLTNELLPDATIGSLNDWNSFNSEADLIDQLRKMLSARGSSIIEEQAAMSYRAIRDRHMPEHRGERLVDFIVKNS